ncbi:MAG: adenylate/guanylate cyclase domain-containing protein [Caldilineales bacterium]|nr:adenylate/guanylate cyclase domain-containing protein [Caldilineales bacterium]
MEAPLPPASLLEESIQDRPPATSHLARALDRLVSIGASPTDSPDLRHRKRIILAAIWIAVPATALSATSFYQLDAYWVVFVLTLGMILNLIWLGALRLRPALFPFFVHWICLQTLYDAIIIAALFGGLIASGGNMMWALLAPLGALMGLGLRAARFYFAAFVLTLLACLFLPLWITPIYTLDNLNLMFAITAIIVCAFIAVVIAYFVRQSEDYQARSDALLRNILPAAIAERLKYESGLIAEQFDQASILFADVVNFTPMSSDLAPDQLVNLLNDVFSEFDSLVEKAGIEKIKTIGDAYMVASGVPTPRPDHAHALATLALDLREALDRCQFGGRQLAIRIGIHSGPVVAGVIGRNKFSYDLWGDTVNTASRMESHSLPGRIQITEATHSLLGDEFICEPRGVVEIKGKGAMKTWFLVGKK